MSARKRKRKQNINNNKIAPKKVSKRALSPKMLEKVQCTHLEFLEEWSETLPKVAEVPIMKAMTYFLVQMLNQRYINTETQEGQK